MLMNSTDTNIGVVNMVTLFRISNRLAVSDLIIENIK